MLIISLVQSLVISKVLFNTTKITVNSKYIDSFLIEIDVLFFVIQGARGTNITIDVVCKAMLNESQPNIIQRMVDVNNMLLQAYDQKCLDAGYRSMINQLRDISWNASASEGGRQWTYQTCVEFGFFQSSNDSQQPFGNNFPVE